MNCVRVITCVLLFCWSGNSYAATVFYDAPSGDIFVNIVPDNVDRILGFELNSKASRLITENYQRLGGPTDLFILRPSVIAEGGALVGGYQSGLYHLGPIYPSNVSEEAFIDDVDGQWAPHGSATTLGFDFAFERPTGIPLNDADVVQVDSWASSVSLVYFAPTGELTLATDGNDGGFLTAFRIDGTFAEAAQFESGGSFTASDKSLESFGLVPPGSYSLGQILPANLTVGGLEERITEARFIAGDQLGRIDVDVFDVGLAMTISFVPEPNSQVFIASALLFTWPLRRKRVSD